MKSYVAYNELLERDVEIFRLDDYGNLFISGNLTLGPQGVLTAAGLDVPTTADLEIVRDPAEMEVPFMKTGSAIYYLGDTVHAGDTYTKDGVEYQYSQDYVYGTWFEKYVYGYDCEILVDAVTADGFSTPNGATFRTASAGTYAHNKLMLDAYPTTAKIVLTAVPSTGNDDTGHWEVKYYDVSDDLLYNDVLSTNLIDNSDYHFPFTPLDANSYSADAADIPISVGVVYGTREVAPIDFSLYMPKAGGTFSGDVLTQNIYPVGVVSGVSPYSIGTNESRYNKGFFNELVAKVVSAEALNIEELNIDSFGLSEGKTDIEPGDTLIIADGSDNGNLKRAQGITFTSDTTKYLRQDGQFGVPDMTAPSADNMEETEKLAGKLVQYTGASDAFFTNGVLYLGVDSTTYYQIIIKGAGFNNTTVTNAGIFPVSSLNSSSVLITAINALNIGTVNSYIEEQGYITLMYSSGAQGWYIEGQQSRGVVSKNTTLAGHTNAELIEGLITNNSIFDITETSPLEISVTINKFLWKPVNPIQFNGTSTNKYLSQAGTWETVPEGGGGGEVTPVSPFTPAEEIGDIGTEAYRYILGTVSMNNATGEIIVTGLDSLKIPGVYEIRNTNSLPEYSIAVKVSSNTVYQTITTIKWNDAIKNFARTIPDRIMRKGTLNNNVVTWENWVHIYTTGETRVALDVKGTWRTPTYDELYYLLNTRANYASLWGLAIIGTVPGLIILDDAGTLPTITGAHFTSGLASGFETNEYTKAEWDKYYSSLMVFLPCTGKRVGTVVSNTKDKTTPLGLYWTASQDDPYIADPKSDATSYALSVGNAATGLSSFTNENGFAVRLVKTSSTGQYSVSASRKVAFASGNLQYHPANNIFRFARNQYDTIDEFNVNMDAAYSGWTDLFGYGTSGITGTGTETYNVSDDPGDYTTGSIEGNPNLDWGQNNSIYRVSKPSSATCLEEEY